MTPQIKQRIEQIRRGEVPAGYKKTKVGVVPTEWEETRFKKMFSRLSRKNKENNDNVLTISAQYGLISQRDFFNKDIASDDKSNYFLLHKGEFAYNKSYSNGYPFGALKRLDMYDKGIVSPLYICFSANENNECPDFYVHYFEAGMMNREIQAFAQEGARNHGLLNISVDDFFNSYLLMPPRPEQEKIAEILSAQDKLIALKEKLIEEKKRQKKYLMQQLLTGKKRLPGVGGEWDTIALGKCCTSEPQYGINAPACEFTPTLPKYIRITDINDYRKYDNTSPVSVKADNHQNYILKTNDIVLVRTGSTTGKSYLYDEKDGILVYAGFLIRFAINPNTINPYFVFGVLDLPSYWKWVKIASMRSGQPGINASEYSDYKFKYPVDLAEQDAIVKILCSAEYELNLLNRDLDQEKQKKKALMQLLLTGIVRV